jgi:hypothetical protein
MKYLSSGGFLILFFFSFVCPRSASSRDSPKPNEWIQVHWTQEKWTANEKPYATARLQIIRQFKRDPSQPKAFRLYKSHRDKALEHPRDSAALFSWGYAYRVASMLDPKIVGYVDGNTLSQKMETFPSPRSHEFARLRYLLVNQYFPDFSLKPLGKRLLKRDPRDLTVGLYYLKTINMRIPHEKQEGIALSRSFVSYFPNQTVTHVALANIYYRVWLATGKRQDGQIAIAAYQRCLQRANLPVKDKRKIEALIHEIQGSGKDSRL